MSTAVRLPAVAGRFYPADADTLAREVGDLIGDTQHASGALGVMVPHAGYVYSGRIAGKTFARVEVPGNVIVLAPNHTGVGARVAVLARGVFRVPGIDIPIAEDLADALIQALPHAKADESAHLAEHAIEVVLPFVSARARHVRVVPIVLGGLGKKEVLAIGARLADVATDDTLVIASSDMSHYLADDESRKRDQLALDPLLALDPAGLFDAVRKHEITMCGVLPTTAMLACALARGAQTATLVEYGTSGDAFGDRTRVVGYAGVVVS